MKSAIYVGTIGHKRFIPKEHSFQYPFFMWYLDLDNISSIPNLGRWFSTMQFALSKFVRSDYLGPSELPIGDAVRSRMKELTGHRVTGNVFGLLNMRTLGLYFSPVNFYYGFDGAGQMSHLLAEVSNIPWNERHHYAHYVSRNQSRPNHPKSFYVSPFNPTDQIYKWKIGVPEQTLAINLGVHDHRGHIFEARLRLEKQSFSIASARKQLLKKPVMTAFIVAGIYWQALKIYLKGIPYIPYQKEKT